MAEAKALFSAPIPGQALSSELGSRPWQQPAKYSNVEDALEHYADKITDPSINASLLDAIEMGTPITSIAEVLVQGSAMEGLHTIDVSILLLPVIMELLAYVADEAEIEYNMGLQGSINQDVISESKISLAMNKLRKKMPVSKDKEPMETPEVQPEESPQPTGLMARPRGEM